MRLLNKIVVAVFFVLYASFVNSQEIKELNPVLNFDSIVEIGAVQIVGAKNQTIGRNLLTISKAEIESMAVNSVDELLRFIPGVAIQSRGAFGSQSDITLRGSTFNQVLVMIDGVRINDPLTGHFNGYIPITIEEIESIEIVKGAAASIYGADAVGGVINFISVYNSHINKENASIEIKGGSNKYYGLESSLVSKDATGWFYGGGLQLNSSRGEHFDNPNFVNLGLGPATYNTNFDLKTYSAAIGKQLNDQWKFYIRSSYDDRTFNAKYFYTASSYDESVEETKVLFTQAKLTKIGNKTRTVIDVAHRYGEDFFEFNPLFSPNNHRSQYYIVQANQYYEYSDKLKFNYGLQADLRKVFSNDRGNHENTHFGGFLLMNYFVNPEFVINAGLRVDQDDNYGVEVNPHINLKYDVEQFSFRGSINRAVRAADYTERYVSTQFESLSAGRNLGNPNLTAESSLNAEIGVDFQLTKSQKISATYFSRYSQDLIDYVFTLGADIDSEVGLDDASGYLYSTNIGEVVTNGLEIDWMGQHQMDRKTKLIYGIGYTWLDTKKKSKFWSVEEDSADVDFELSKYLTSHAKHLVNGHLTIEGGFWSFGTQALWKNRNADIPVTSLAVIDKDFKKDYLMVDVFLNFDITKKLKIGAEVHNIGDVQTQDIYGAVLPGRWFVGKLTMNL